MMSQDWRRGDGRAGRTAIRGRPGFCIEAETWKSVRDHPECVPLTVGRISLPSLTRQSILVILVRKKMDPRVEPADEGWSNARWSHERCLNCFAFLFTLDGGVLRSESAGSASKHW